MASHASDRPGCTEPVSGSFSDWLSLVLSRTQLVALDEGRILGLCNEVDRVQILLIDTEWGVETVCPLLVLHLPLLIALTPLSYGLLEKVYNERK